VQTNCSKKDWYTEVKDKIREDLGKMKVQNWSKMAAEREAWRRIAEQAKTHKEL
jgi:hypothetical protein